MKKNDVKVSEKAQREAAEIIADVKALAEELNELEESLPAAVLVMCCQDRGGGMIRITGAAQGKMSLISEMLFELMNEDQKFARLIMAAVWAYERGGAK